MKITYDNEANAASIKLIDHIPSGGSAHTYGCPVCEIGYMLNLDFSKRGVLISIEVLGARSTLPRAFLDHPGIIRYENLIVPEDATIAEYGRLVKSFVDDAKPSTASARIVWDKTGDVAHVYLDRDAPGGVAKTFVCERDGVFRHTISLDLDTDGRLIGVEVWNAREALPRELLDQAEIIG
jgi:uncharacterized protein YuzE